MKVDAGDLPASANLLIEKVSQFIGAALLPRQTVRVARAETEAALIRAQSEIKITNLQRRAIARFFEEQAQQQKVMEDVTLKALPLVSATADPSQIDDDWARNFFDKVRNISNDDMQTIWARLLAGEANDPGSFSKRTVNILAELDATDARSFETLCRFCWGTKAQQFPIVFNSMELVYTSNGLTGHLLGLLESLGLITLMQLGSYSLSIDKPAAVAMYHGERLFLAFQHPEGTKELGIGQVAFTKWGKELAMVVNTEPAEGFFDYVRTHWPHYAGVNVTIETSA